MRKKMNMSLPADYDGRAQPYHRVDSMALFKAQRDNRPTNYRLADILKQQDEVGKDEAPSEEYVRDLTRVKLWALVIFTLAFFVYTFIHFDLQDRTTSKCPTPEERAAAGIVVPTDITRHDC